MLIPIGIESLFNYARCASLFRVDGDDRKWVGKTEDIAFNQAIGRNDWKEFVQRISMMRGDMTDR